MEPFRRRISLWSRVPKIVVNHRYGSTLSEDLFVDMRVNLQVAQGDVHADYRQRKITCLLTDEKKVILRKYFDEEEAEARFDRSCRLEDAVCLICIDLIRCDADALRANSCDGKNQESVASQQSIARQGVRTCNFDNATRQVRGS